MVDASLNPCCNGRCSLTVFPRPLRCYHWGLNPCCNGRCSLTRCSWFYCIFWYCLNPCCNGRCSLTGDVVNSIPSTGMVLILVVMEDALWLICGGVWYLHVRVLILVVMEDALWLRISNLPNEDVLGLNPCCNGRCSLTGRNSGIPFRKRRVLILVVMEDALWLVKSMFNSILLCKS